MRFLCCCCCRRRESGAEAKYDPVPPNPVKASERTADVADDGIALSKRQRFLLQNNWKAIARHMEPAGAELFVKLLADDPSLARLFSFSDTIVNSSKEGQLRDEALRQHGQGVMIVFDQLISAIDDADRFFGILDQYARSHAVKPNFSPDYFARVRDPFLYAIRTSMGDRYTDNMHNIYQVFIDTVLQGIQTRTRGHMEPNGTAN